MQTRFVRKEMELMKRLAAFLSELMYLQEDMKDRLENIDGGNELLTSLLNNTTDLFSKLLNSAPQNQIKQLQNVLTDYKVELVPRLKPTSQNVLMAKDQAKALIDIAQEKCKTCVENSITAQKCPIYNLLEVTALPDRYDTITCPFSLAEWAD